MLAILPAIIPALLTAGVGPLLGLVAKAVAPRLNAATRRRAGGRTIAVTRGVQGLSVWALIGALLSNTDFWLAVLPPVQGFFEVNFSETMVGGIVALVMTVVYEALRRISDGPVG